MDNKDNNVEIKVQYVDKDMPKLEYVEGIKSNWIDLRAAETVTMIPGDFRVIALSGAMQLPDGYEAIVAPRSSTFKKWGILMANGIGR